MKGFLQKLINICGISTFTTKFIILHIILAVLFFILYLFGIAEMPFTADITYMSTGIGILFLVGIGFSAMQRWKAVAWLADMLVFFGLLGTIIGAVIAFSGVDPEQVTNIDNIIPMISSLIYGIGIALYTTLVGSVGYIWLSFLHHLLNDEK